MSQETATANTGGTSSIQTLFNVFLNPREAFEAVDRKPTWVLPFVVILLFSLVAAIFITPIAMEQKLEDQRDKLIEERGMTPEEADEAMEMGAKIGRIVGPITAPIAAALGLVIIAAVLLFLGNIVLGGESKFKKVFSMYTYSSLIGVLGMLIKLLFIIPKRTMDSPLSLAYYLGPEDKGTFLYQLFSKVELFTIWQLVIVSIGMAVIYKFTTKKAAYGVVILYLIYAVIASVITAALS